MCKKALLWLDDFRNPYENDFNWVSQYVPEYKKFDIYWVKNYHEFVIWISDNGLPHTIAFDHDLACEHYAPQEFYSEKYNDWATSQNFKEKTGLDCAKWLVNHCIENYYTLPEWVIQSANLAGVDNINSYLNTFLKYYKNDTLSER